MTRIRARVFVPPLLTLGLVFSAGGCRSAPTSESQPRPVDVARPAAPGTSIDEAFFALGALAEYGSYQPDGSGDRIATFAANRGAEAIVFARALQRYADRRGIDAEVVVRDGEGGCTVVASEPMKNYLVSLYPPTKLSSERIFQSSPALFKDRASKLSYLAGVYLRWRAGSTLQFFNSGHKARLVKDLLIEAGCEDVALTGSPRGSYPAVVTLSYKPSAEIGALFASVDEDIAAARG